ncbi:TetR/AcrR family transcriptional regulator [Arthrobacter sp. B2a2-09]|uniref:TetR/AcrR family transcriptional regulator n=1 Tax=Arthrobacter sp. B2a2-09 TaxID=2952822 RepID=UPI0022CDB594|nr:TetR/AcrR family transcriptional regulator [Arthrobacter sp. B2a2-09]MCZ9880589.1 TetR/AcrR family transcriptional regulator [Arthrobacter sp. B2a2-09]
MSATRSSSRRGALLDAVIASVAEHGFERSSLRDIAARAGMTHVGLLRHFPGKAELLITALEDQEERERLELERAISGGASDTEAMALLLEILTRDREATKNWLALAIASSDPEHPAHAFFRHRQDGFRRVVAEFSRRADTPNVGMFDPTTRATLLIAVVDGLRLQWLIDPTIDAAAAASRFSDLILRSRTSQP